MLRIYLGQDTQGIRPTKTLVPTEEHNDLNEATFNIKVSSDGNSDFSFGDNVQFFGQSAKYVYSVLIANQFARINTIKVEIKEECCAEVTLFKGIIKYNTIDFAPYEDGIKKGCDCGIVCTFEEDTTKSVKYDCIRNNLIKEPCRDPITKNAIPCENSFTGASNFENYNHPFLRYCSCPRPAFLGYMLNFTAAPLSLIMLTLIPLFVVIAAIIVVFASAICGLSFGTCSGCCNYAGNADDAFGWTDDAYKFINKFIVPCNDGHITPYVRHYIQNVCEKCGLEFDSSILNSASSPYYNTVLLTPGGNDGNEFYDGDTRSEFWSSSAPTDNLISFLNNLKTVFNAHWWIANNVLFFESTETVSSVWIDFSQPINAYKIVNLKYQWEKIEIPAGAKLEYQKDALDSIGNENMREYKDIIDFRAQSANPQMMAGLREVMFPFAPLRAVNDGLGKCCIFDTAFKVFAGALSLGSVIPDIERAEDRGYILLSDGKAMLPKLVIIDQDRSNFNSGQDSYAVPIRESHPNKNDAWMYNKPYYISDGIALPNQDKTTLQPSENLYQFFQKDDPNLPDNDRLSIGFNLEFMYDCSILQSLIQRVSFEESDVIVKIEYCDGNARFGTVKEIQVKNNGTISLTGII